MHCISEGYININTYPTHLNFFHVPYCLLGKTCLILLLTIPGCTFVFTFTVFNAHEAPLSYLDFFVHFSL